MSASQRACRKLQEWLAACLEMGWRRSDLPALTDLWWEHHDEQTGELIPSPSTTPRRQEDK